MRSNEIRHENRDLDDSNETEDLYRQSIEKMNFETKHSMKLIGKKYFATK